MSEQTYEIEWFGDELFGKARNLTGAEIMFLGMLALAGMRRHATFDEACALIRWASEARAKGGLQGEALRCTLERGLPIVIMLDPARDCWLILPQLPADAQGALD